MNMNVIYEYDLLAVDFPVAECAQKDFLLFIDHIQQESALQGDLPEMRTTALLSRRAMEAAGRKQRKKETF